ncbi:Chemotaxis protein CheA [Pseudomonas oleovorans subsp. oleovorans]|uniref:Chemotaxis protein CheA n=1 Tax=Ectopseudomonas oleovorans TaxID=301 RepID=A0A379JSK9_ECTOL|nr:Hpt domain-containing protein [Pseudomonas oleovorans]OWK49321.1 Chemotaxis protein CheA [Pseudomonas oleovorans subsp. oleovorans]SEI60284.1 chemosensory pili system protein ChpA (sensor histidine kinase/response regulator) [Pseudomonas oleovorans]SUD51627.1 CheA signal transduction histidine kinase [Pseudomonas oleovorans]
MGDRHDYVALEWVKGEIGETLKQARQALEAFVENPQDPTRMRFCLTYVHQVHGTLQMVEFYGAALLAEEMEQLAKALMEGRVANQGEALEVLMQAILQLPVYLDRIQTARRDLPMVVLPLLNDLRAARGEKLLSETSLFSPDMSARLPALPEGSMARLRTAELPVLLRKLRQMLQMALVGVIRNQDLPTNLGYMARVFARLETLCQDAPLGGLWQIASGMVEGLANGSVVNGTSVRTLLRQVDKELKRLVEQGADGINQPAPDELTKNLLFYVAKAPAQSPRIRALKEQYRLDEALPDTDVVDEERARLAGPDRDAMRSVVAALCEELVRVKDSLDLFVRSDRTQPGELDALLAPLKQIADTLAVLGFGQPRKVILDQIDVVHSLSLGQREPNDAVLMDVAGALLYVEATLAGMVGPSEASQNEQSRLPTTDVAQIHQLVIKEARNGLEQAKDAIIEFIASQWNHEHLARVPELLTQVRGGLAMIPLQRAADLLNACNRYIQEQLLARQAVPNWQSLDTLADAITSVEYYLERLAEDHGTQGDLILDVAEESLEALGYPLKEKPSILDRVEPQEESLAPLADPLQEIELLGAEDEQLEEPLAETEALIFDVVEPSSDEVADLQLLDAEPEQSDARETADSFTFELDELEELPALQDEETVAAPLLDAEPELELEELSLDQLAEPAQWDELELADLELPEVELPSAPQVQELPDEPAAEKPLSMADVMAAPVQAINPPAADVPPSLLPPPADEEPVDEELLEVFIEEVGEVLETIGEYLPQWQADTDNKDALIEVRRAFHTLKGSGRMVRALIIGELGWSIENLLNRVLDRSIEPSAPVQQVVLDVVALMPALVDEFAAKAQRQRDDVDLLAATAHALAKGLTPPKSDAPATQQVAEPVGVDDATEVVEQVESVTDQPLDSESLDGEPLNGEPLDPQLLEIFRNEAETHLDTLVGFLADCAQELPQPVTDDLQRALHTLKGSAYMAGILPVAEIAAPLEKLVKEFKTNLIQVDLAAAELLSSAEGVFRIGLDNLETQPLAPIPGAEAFLARVQALHQERLANAEDERMAQSGESRDPQMISIFLAEGMDILLDAEDLLRKWREHPSERQELSALLEELTTLGRGAEMAELPQIDELCEALLDLYGAVEEGSLAVSERFFDEAEKAHEALIGMMDQVAAALQVSPQPERVQALRELLSEAIDPHTLALLAPGVEGLEIIELDQATAELEQAEAEPAQWQETLAEPAIFEDAGLELQAEAELGFSPVDADLDEEMVEIFLEEAVDILDSAGQALERWLSEPDNTMPLSSLQRDLHTLKGGARMAAIRPIGDLGHELESLYEGLVDRRYNYSPALGSLLQQSHDRLAQMLDQLQARQPLVSGDDLIQAIRQFRQGGTPQSLSAAVAQVEPALDDELVESIETVEPDSFELPPLALVEDDIVLDEAPQAEPEAGLPLIDEVELVLPEDELPPLAEAVVEPESKPQGTTLANWHEERDPELVEIFLEEGFDIIDSAGAALQRWMGDVDNSLELEALQRDLHTLKGGARMAEIREIGDLAHELEFLYEGLGGGRLRASQELFTLLQACHDRLAEMLEAVRGQRAVPQGHALIETIKRFRANPDEQLSMPSAVQLKAVVESDDTEEADSDILDIFLEEGDDLLEAMEAAIGRWEEQRDDSGAIDEMLRILHTLKGGARLAGQKRLGDLSHDLEQHLSEALQQGAPWPESLLLDLQSGFEGLQKELDVLRQRLSASLADEPVAVAAEPATAPVNNLLNPIVAASDVPNQLQAPKVLPFVQRAQEAALEAASRRAPQELVKVPAELLEGLVNLAGETSIFRGRVEQQVSDVGFTLSEMEATIDRVRDQLRRLDTETQAQILSRYQAEAERAGYEDFDPLEMDRHSQLQQLSRALFESASDLLDLKETLAAKNRDAETLLLQQARVNTELQEGLMRTRMVPFDRLVPRLRRIVRQVAGELGKQVEFVVGNADGEMDRTVLERIVAPLEHMLRNAVDHGIEPSAVRRDVGKPETGTIRLNLGREGGDIVLTLDDDGGGIRLDAVRRKAIERGMMDADSDLTDHEILQFILEAGFSTAEKVTQISGRGVGMDVVHSEVKQLGGSMSIDSAVGQGTRFTIRLPFTVSVNRALMVYSGEDLYAIPLNTIEGIVRVSPYELEAYYAPDAPRFEYAGQAYELKYLGDLLNNGQQPKLVGQSLPLPVILVRSSEHAVAVQVDSLAGSREIVVKSLGPQFAGVHGISGATILGDGRVVVILDLLATIRVLHAHLQNQLMPRLASRQAATNEEVEADRPPLVMVVDDSVTVRKVTSRLLERNGMNVVTAKDGVDAIAQLQEHKPDIMLLDIEMPRMDGFEVATLVRHDERLKDLPIIMITSRTGEKHRERAMSIGVNQYLGKPYQESLLLDTIAQLVDSHRVKRT